MFILHRLLQAIATVLGYAVDAYILMVLVHALLSWVNPDPRNPIVRFLAAVVEPALKPFRRILSPYKTGGVDVSPVFLIFVLLFVKHFVVPVLWDLSGMFR
jgi:YggT family protein